MNNAKAWLFATIRIVALFLARRSK